MWLFIGIYDSLAGDFTQNMFVILRCYSDDDLTDFLCKCTMHILQLNQVLFKLSHRLKNFLKVQPIFLAQTPPPKGKYCLNFNIFKKNSEFSECLTRPPPVQPKVVLITVQPKVVLITVQTFSVNITTMISMRSLVINLSINQ